MQESISYKKKICLLGMFGVGKTSLIRRYVNDCFDDSYLSTIGVKVSQKLLPAIEKSPGKMVQLSLMIWDIEGFEKDSLLHKNYYVGATGAILVADLTRKETITDLDEILSTFLKISPNSKFIFVGNKIDIYENNFQTKEELKKLAKQHNAEVLFSSAKTGKNVEQSFLKLGELITGKI